jgi:hypothetical protein
VNVNVLTKPLPPKSRGARTDKVQVPSATKWPLWPIDIPSSPLPVAVGLAGPVVQIDGVALSNVNQP